MPQNFITASCIDVGLDSAYLGNFVQSPRNIRFAAQKSSIFRYFSEFIFSFFDRPISSPNPNKAPYLLPPKMHRHIKKKRSFEIQNTKLSYVVVDTGPIRKR